ncbi:MAG: recombinase family protein [Deinococcota bacterium]|nr:recombinase family protein [Deinococcota bacterium]
MTRQPETNKALRVAIYSRVSKDDDSQTPENQLLELRAYCERQGYDIVEEYVDYESGRKGKAERKRFAELLKDASQRKFDLLLLWSLDRFSREGIRKTLNYLELLEGYGVAFKSYTEEYLDTSNELLRHIVVGTIAYFAELEAKRISERTKAGLARVKAKGKRLGRPTKFVSNKHKLERLLEQGYSKQRIADRLGLSLNTTKKYIRQLEQV